MRKHEFVSRLASSGTTFTFEDARKVSSLTHGSLRNLLYRLEAEGWIERIEKGKYMIIPLSSRKGRYTLNEFIIGSMLVEPACISYWSALHHHGFTEQIPATVFVQTTARKKNRDTMVFGVRYRMVRVTAKKFFGIDNVWFNERMISITDREKTVVDCLDRPGHCGGIAEVAKAIRNEKLDADRLREYAVRISNTGVTRRLGFLCDQYGKDIDLPGIRSRNYLLLDPGLPGKGETNARWRLIINMKALEDLE